MLAELPAPSGQRILYGPSFEPQAVEEIGTSELVVERVAVRAAFLWRVHAGESDEPIGIGDRERFQRDAVEEREHCPRGVRSGSTARARAHNMLSMKLPRWLLRAFRPFR